PQSLLKCSTNPPESLLGGVGTNLWINTRIWTTGTSLLATNICFYVAGFPHNFRDALWALPVCLPGSLLYGCKCPVSRSESLVHPSHFLRPLLLRQVLTTYNNSRPH